MLTDFGTAIDGVRGLLFLLLLLLTLGLTGFALLDAVRHKPQAYVAAGKRTRTFWLSILGVALVVEFVAQNPLNFLSILGLVGAGIYLADVRPALRQVSGRGGSSMGPYGPW